MTIHKLNALTALTSTDEVPVWDADASGEPTKKITAQNMAASVKTLGSLVNTTEMNNALAGKQNTLTFDTTPTTGSTNPVTSGGIANAIAQSTAKYEQVTLTAGSGITINSQDCYTYGKFLIVYMKWTAAANISAYSNIASLGLSAKISWNAPLVTDANVVVENNGLYADKGNSAIRASMQIPAGTYRTFLIIPTT